MSDCINKINNIIKQGYYSIVDSDDKTVPSGKITTSAKDSANAVRLSVYGVVSNPTKNSHSLIFNSQGRESNKFFIANDFVNRLKNLKEGEIGLNNTKNGIYVLLKENGNFEILGSGDYAVRYNELETAFNQLKSDYDDLVTKFNNFANAFNSWTPVAEDGGSALKASVGTISTASSSSADITPAKVETIDLPSS